MGESSQQNSNKGSALKKPKMTKEERRAKYTAIAQKRREKQRNQRGGGFSKDRPQKKKIVCFQCRKSGHTVANCPLNTGNGDVEKSSPVVCYKCGSTEHSLSECTNRDSSNAGLPFAKCFICSEMGHLSSQCSKNKKGIYVNGGSCRYCGSIEHLATKCPNKNERKKKLDPVGDTDINDLLEAPKDATTKSTAPKEKKKRVVKF